MNASRASLAPRNALFFYTIFTQELEESLVYKTNIKKNFNLSGHCQVLGAQRSKDGERVPRPVGSSETFLTTMWSHKI